MAAAESGMAAATDAEPEPYGRSDVAAHTLAVLTAELGAVLVLGGAMLLRISRPWAHQHPMAAAGMRSCAALMVAFLVPLCATSPGPLLPSLLTPVAIFEALYLLGMSLALPLPIRHLVWVLFIELRMVLARLTPLSHLQASREGRGMECQGFAIALRLAAATVVPGAVADSRAPLSLQRYCWMAGLWSALMIGWGLPAALQLALWQHRRQQIAVSQALHSRPVADGGDPGAAQQAAVGSRVPGGAGQASGPGRNASVATVRWSSPVARELSAVQGSGSSESSSQTGSSDSYNGAFREQRRSHAAARPALRRSSLLPSDGAGPRALRDGHPGSVHSSALAKAQLAACVAYNLLLLLPLGTALWMLLELAARCGHT